MVYYSCNKIVRPATGCPEEITMSNIKTVTEADFNTAVIQSETPVLVDFYADWCMPCKYLTPALEALAAEHAGRVSVVQINVDLNLRLATQYEITSIPCVVCFKSGTEHRRSVGVVPKETLLSLTL
jgi:thioredoxin 1